MVTITVTNRLVGRTYTWGFFVLSFFFSPLLLLLPLFSFLLQSHNDGGI